MVTVHTAEINTLVCDAASSGLNIAGSPFSGWVGAVAAALMASLMLLLFFYLLSQLFRNPQWTGMVKFELYELLTTLILIVVVLGFTGSMCGLTVGSLMPSTDPAKAAMNIYEATTDHFTSFSSILTRDMTLNHILNFQLDQWASVTIYSRPLGVGIVASPLAGFASPFKQITYNITFALALAYLINIAFLYVYEFAIFAFLKFYLPAGIILRSFTPTRRIGGSLIALSIGFLLILPFTMSITNIMFLDPTHGTVTGFMDQATRFFEDSNTIDQLTATLRSVNTDSFIDIVNGGIFGTLGDIAERMVGGSMTFLFLMPTSIVAQAFALGYIMPALNILVLIQTVKSLSKSIGEEIDITALTRMI